MTTTPIFSYALFGLTVASEIELLGLPPGTRQPDVFIRRGHVSQPATQATLEEEIVRHPVGGAFRIRGGREIIADTPAGISAEVLSVLLSGRVMAYLLRQRGWLALHASAVMLGEKVVLFTGKSGTGKSTTAAAFHRHGHRVLTDDVSPVKFDLNRGACVLSPAGPRVRLLDDAIGTMNEPELEGVRSGRKTVFQLGDRSPIEEELPVTAIYVLDFGDATRIEAVGKVQAAALLSAQSLVRHENLDPASASAHFDACVSVARHCPVLRLVRTRGLEALAAAVVAIDQTC